MFFLYCKSAGLSSEKLRHSVESYDDVVKSWNVLLAHMNFPWDRDMRMIQNFAHFSNNAIALRVFFVASRLKLSWITKVTPQEENLHWKLISLAQNEPPRSRDLWRISFFPSRGRVTQEKLFHHAKKKLRRERKSLAWICCLLCVHERGEVN